MKFEFSDTISPSLVQLLEETTLGTNGAMYRHLDVKERIHLTDSPLSFSLQRNDHLLANITFCKRSFGLYLRYFAFDKRFQSKGKARQTMQKSKLKQEIEAVFQRVEKEHGGTLNMCYAYIDSRNERSKWMSEQFGFRTKAKLVTQTFSRVYPKPLSGISKEKIQEEHLSWIRANYGNHSAYFEYYLNEGVVHCWRSPKGDLLALGKFSDVTWEISRLPGKMGGVFVRVLPYIPMLRKLVNVKQHQFLVPEAICLKEEHPQQLSSFLSGVLAMENRHMMLWWMDEREPLYVKVKDQMNWGIMHRMIGVSSVDVVVRGDYDVPQPIYVTAFDFI
ncbi:MAG: hypothetical protein ACKOXP_01765 [Flavobacteriales bacterium]